MMATKANTALDDFLQWMRNADITWDAHLMEIRKGSAGWLDPGWGVFAKRDLKEGERLCVIPKRSVLSIKTTAIKDIIEVERLRGGLALVLAATYEKARGKESFWYDYFQSMPDREYVPIFWTKEEMDLLKGTDIERKAEEDRDATEEDFESLVAPVLLKYKERFEKCDITLSAFRDVASLVGSRAFFVDEEHGEGLVPLADVFNHKGAVVSLTSEYEVEGQLASSDDDDEAPSEVDDIDGGEPCNDDDRNENPTGSCQEAGGSSGDDGLIGGRESNLENMKGGSKPSILKDDSSKPIDPALRLEIGICSTEINGEDALEIIMASEVKADAEIHNTYGELPNSDLLYKYGFALDSNSFDTVNIDKTSMLENSKAIVGDKEAQRRRKFMKKHSYLMSKEDEPFEIFADGVVCPALSVALRILAAPKETFRKWKSIEDATKATIDNEEWDFSEPEPVSKLGSVVGVEGLMCLRRTLEGRLATYSTRSLAENRENLKSLRESENRSMGCCAEIGACVLRISEIEILECTLKCIDDTVSSSLKARELSPTNGIDKDSKKRKPENGLDMDWCRKRKHLFLQVD
ncbi:hypothetical protein BSKO_10742 [Bryopsis sp. KO-2023]|nr:hypothetical protein BSKO_10742 [Bryopsis sp. KO-2023]